MIFSNAFTPCVTRIHPSAPFSTWHEHWKGLRPVFFGPCTLVRTVGRPSAFVSNAADPNLFSQPHAAVTVSFNVTILAK
jgi:hypothetical protein